MQSWCCVSWYTWPPSVFSQFERYQNHSLGNKKNTHRLFFFFYQIQNEPQTRDNHPNKSRSPRIKLHDTVSVSWFSSVRLPKSPRFSPRDRRYLATHRFPARDAPIASGAFSTIASDVTPVGYVTQVKRVTGVYPLPESGARPRRLSHPSAPVMQTDRFVWNLCIVPRWQNLWRWWVGYLWQCFLSVCLFVFLCILTDWLTDWRKKKENCTK